ncbi:MAG: acetate--CoA ligase family protein, partial [Anaerolineaceae bacterium]|nr:acetate--CoA ligase family protein [Anaerolineaceae bacterium]
MRILEFEAKNLLEDQGLPLPSREVVISAEEAKAAAEKLGGPVVLKAQIPIGGRMKGGGVFFCNTSVEVAEKTKHLLGSVVNKHVVELVLVEKQIQIEKEVFIGFLYDTQERTASVIASISGGIDVEAAGSVFRRPFSCVTSPGTYMGLEVASNLGFEGQKCVRLGSLINGLVKSFLKWDAALLEINPLVLDKDGVWWIADVHLELDDDAAFRQGALHKEVPVSAGLAVPVTQFEQNAIKINETDHRGVAGRLVPFDGNIGMLIGGGGASLTAFDAVLDAGLKPANYCEIGGNPSVWKIQELTKLILSQPQVDRLIVIM